MPRIPPILRFPVCSNTIFARDSFHDFPSLLARMKALISVAQKSATTTWNRRAPPGGMGRKYPWEIPCKNEAADFRIRSIRRVDLWRWHVAKFWLIFDAELLVWYPRSHLVAPSQKVCFLFCGDHVRLKNHNQLEQQTANHNFGIPKIVSAQV